MTIGHNATQELYLRENGNICIKSENICTNYNLSTCIKNRNNAVSK